ncbi:MAG: nucleotidyltransferase family protein [Saprospiraceae bacterium]|nr:nucleotidyltransferase family protein [Saprospiraceae bacterium]
MITKEEILDFLRQQKPLFEKEYQVSKIGLFGSYARGEQHADSDIDLLIEFKSGTADLYGKKEKIRQIVKTRFSQNVDLAREKYLKPYFKNQILQSAIYA